MMFREFNNDPVRFNFDLSKLFKTIYGFGSVVNNK